jgi:large subunit ribosomal protein L10
MNRKEKEEFVATLRAELSEARSIILANSVGIDANSMNELRAEIRASDSQYRIVKNTLAKLAVKDTDLEMLAEHFTGPTALAYSSEDAVAPAKVLFDYRKDDETLEIRGGYLNGKWMDVDGVEQLSKMPGKDEIRAKLLNAMNGVATKFVRVLNAAPSDFVNVLNSRKDSLE